MKKVFYLLLISTFTLFSLTCADPIQKIDNKNIIFLVFGKSNKYVKQLQEFLNQNGFFDCESGFGSPGNETEDFGNCTESGIKIFQEFRKIEITGKIDPKTMTEINSYISESQDEVRVRDENPNEPISIKLPVNEEKKDISGFNLDSTLDDVYSGKKDVTDIYNSTIADKTKQDIDPNVTIDQSQHDNGKNFFSNFFEKNFSGNKDKPTYNSLVQKIWNTIFNFK